MKLLNRLERRFGSYAIPNLMMYIIGFNFIVFAISYARPEVDIIGRLALIPVLVMSGEVWRLVTYIFIPPTFSLFWILFILYFYYIVGTGLEHEWGSFRFNIYYLAGMAGTTIAAFISGGATGLYLNMSLFLAFAHIYPNFEILLFFIIPVKVKYLAWLNWAFIAFTVLTAPVTDKLAAVASVFNFFLFFGKDIIAGIKAGRAGYSNRQRFAKTVQKKSTIHKCTICGITEENDPRMEFRYCSTCKGDYEYCMNHLKNHEHIS
ncbi:MAG: hypothetical protein HY754_14395 [Nitrospirae bacterium]|nr:hypothetical protein [Nitrospirota bacterium]